MLLARHTLSCTVRSILLLALACMHGQALRARDKEDVHAVGKEGLTLEGKVEKVGPRVKVTVGDKSVELPAKLFLVKLAAGKKYHIAMDSKELDSVLVVQDRTGRQLAWNDDSGGGLNALLALDVLGRGEYRLFAASNRGFGKFTLHVKEDVAVELHEVGAGLAINGTLSATPALTYYIKLAADKTYVVDMISANPRALDPFLRLLGPAGKCVAEDDDSGGDLNARITFKAEDAGTYQVVAASVGKGRGIFSLAFREASKVDEVEALVAPLKRQAADHENREQYAQARKAREEALAMLRKALGPDHWKVTDARLTLAFVDLLARLTPDQRRQLVQARQLNQNANTLHAQGKFVEATRIAAHGLELHRQLLGEKHRDYATSLHNLALMYESRGEYAKAEALFRQVADITKQVLGTKHPDYAASINKLALVCHTQGNCAKAEPLYLQALDLRKQVLGEQHPDYANSLHNLASLYKTQGAGPKAEPLFRQARDLRKQVQGEQHPDYAASLNGLASLYESQGEYAKAEPLFRQALDLRKQVLGARHPEYANSLNNLASLYESQGEYAKAEPLFRQALDIKKQVLGEQHRDYATSLSNLAHLYESQGEYAKAEPLFRQALDLRKQVLGARHPEYANSLNNLAVLYRSRGQYVKAEPLFRQALDLRKQALGEKHPGYATSLNNLALLYYAQGDYAKAEPLFRQALDMRKQVLGEKHPAYATSLSDLAVLYQSQGEYCKAEPLFRHALHISKEVLGEKHRDYATILNNLALLYKSHGEYAKAEALFRQALVIEKQVLGEKHPDFAKTLNNLAVLYTAQGEFDKAEPLFRQAIVAMSQASNDSPIIFDKLTAAAIRLHPESMGVLANNSRMLAKRVRSRPTVAQLRQLDHALSLALAVRERFRREGLKEDADKLHHTGENFDVISNRIGASRVLYLLEGKTANLETAFAAAEQGSARGFLEQLGKARAHAVAGVSPELSRQEADLHGRLRSLARRIAKEQDRPTDKRDPENVGRLLAEEKQAQADLEKLIERYHKEYPRFAQLWYPEPCTVAQARACLAKNEIALVFVVAKGVSYVVSLQARPADADKTGGLAIHELDGADDLAEIAAPLADPDVLSKPARVKALGRQAFERVLAPLKDRIKGKDLVIVPGGSLCLMPFEVLVDDDQFLIERHRIRYAPSLTALHVVRQWNKSRQPAQGLFALGDPVYDARDARLKPGSALTATASEPARRDLRNREDGKGTEFVRLVSSGKEVAAIGKLLQAPPGSVLTGPDALEARVKAASASGALAKARHVHFATHGVLGFDVGQQPALVLSLVGNDDKLDEDGGRDDGFLRLDEISRLKLNADLVVLSACRTGEGRLKSSEGVTGIARAFLFAGSKAVVCSLWSVDDAETARLMTGMYQRIQKGMSSPNALREARLAMIREGKSPFYWAPFILLGE